MQTAAFAQRRKPRPPDGAPRANGPLPALVCGGLECITPRCSSGRLCPRHVCRVPSCSPGLQCCFCTTSPGELQQEELVCDGVSSCLAGGGSPEGLGRLAGAAWGSGDPNIQSPLALGRGRAWPRQILSALWSWDRDWQRAVPGASPPALRTKTSVGTPLHHSQELFEALCWVALGACRPP